LPLPGLTPNTAGSWPIVIVSPSPNRNPSSPPWHEIGDAAHNRSTPAPARTAADTSASAADSAANFETSPCASGPTAAADSAEVAVVALTTNERERPISA
jgi:hypothetical protein